MSNASDFVIENGVLTKYKGKAAEVEIPEAMQNEYVRHMMPAENIIPPDDARTLVDEAAQKQNGEVVAELLAYLENK